MEETANANAQACVMRHDKCRATSNYPDPGQNMGTLTAHGDYSDSDETIEHFINHWFDQNKGVDMSVIESYHTTKHHAANFARMVNDQALQIGCSYIKFEKDDDYTAYFVCNYSSDVKEGEPVYEQGDPCSACPDDASECSSDNTSLCTE